MLYNTLYNNYVSLCIQGSPLGFRSCPLVLEMAIQTLIKEFPEAREETEAFRGENKKRREARGKTTRKPRPTPSKVNTAESRSISIYELDNQSIDYIAFYGFKG